LSISLPAAAPTSIYTLSLHDALPISILSNETHDSTTCLPGVLMGAAGQKNRVYDHRRRRCRRSLPPGPDRAQGLRDAPTADWRKIGRAHVELQSPCNLVCRLLLQKKK